ncbi:MAG: cyclic nucleotide-binding domain-containing protein, partial [Syntrophales bacterium]|nr:cyclic nucleotide-binding domain-containing protein [Syntrophales bacterium]
MESIKKPFEPIDYRAIHLLRNVNLDAVRGLIETCNLAYLETGEVLISPGQMHHRIYLILEGQISIHLGSPDEDPITVLMAGESVGEMSVLDRKPTSAYAVARTPCRLLVMDEDVLWSLVHASHDAACNLLITLTKRLRRTDSLIVEDINVERSYERQGTFDALTGLHNRFWLENTLD